jgi:hypothetical protein
MGLFAIFVKLAILDIGSFFLGSALCSQACCLQLSSPGLLMNIEADLIICQLTRDFFRQ